MNQLAAIAVKIMLDLTAHIPQSTVAKVARQLARRTAPGASCKPRSYGYIYLFCETRHEPTRRNRREDHA